MRKIELQSRYRLYPQWYLWLIYSLGGSVYQKGHILHDLLAFALMGEEIDLPRRIHMLSYQMLFALFFLFLPLIFCARIFRSCLLLHRIRPSHPDRPAVHDIDLIEGISFGDEVVQAQDGDGEGRGSGSCAGMETDHIGAGTCRQGQAGQVLGKLVDRVIGGAGDRGRSGDGVCHDGRRQGGPGDAAAGAHGQHLSGVAGADPRSWRRSW